jgi:hypothetical protein
MNNAEHIAAEVLRAAGSNLKHYTLQNRERIIAAATAAIAAMEGWIKPTDRLPEKPGKTSYEYVDCLIVHKGDVLKRPWNCEHLCFDDEHYDDHFCDAAEVDYWMPLPAPPQHGGENG